MADGNQKSLPDPRRVRSRIGAGFFAVGLLLASTGCGSRVDGVEAGRQLVEKQMRLNYTMQLRGIAPAFVVITYPETIGLLSPSKRDELNLVKQILNEISIPYELHKRSDVLDEISIGRSDPVVYPAYAVPTDIAEAYRGNTILFLNLESTKGTKTIRHPTAKKYDLSVLVWDDPVTLASTSRASS